MKTVGSMLKEARIGKKLSLEQVERDTKIRLKFLTAIESDDYSRLPSVSYAKGFIKNYGVYVGLSADTVLAFFRRQTQETPKATLLPKGVSEPLNGSRFRLTPGRFLALLLFIFAGIFLVYFGLQYRKLQIPPFLSLDSPKEKLVSGQRRIDVFGKTDPDATVTINTVSVLVRKDGRFFDQITLEDGIQTITIVATSRFGKSKTLVREVAYQPNLIGN